MNEETKPRREEVAVGSDSNGMLGDELTAAYLLGFHKRDDLVKYMEKIQKALGNGANENLWRPGEHWVDAACRAINFCENYFDA